jgi:hypothetical protein
LTQQLVLTGDTRDTVTPDPGTAADGGASFRREGEVWAIGYADRVIRLRDAKGLHFLARLLREPGREFHVLDLGREGDDTGPHLGGHEYVPMREEGLAAGFGEAGAVLDSRAKAEYRRRMEELSEEIEEAVSFNDPERAAAAEAELDALKTELVRAVGLGGRDRAAASSAERARLNVTRAIRSAVQRIAAAHPELGEHLRLTIRTGTFCSYQPDPAARVVWDV